MPPLRVTTGKMTYTLHADVQIYPVCMVMTHEQLKLYKAFTGDLQFNNLGLNLQRATTFFLEVMMCEELGVEVRVDHRDRGKTVIATERMLYDDIRKPGTMKFDFHIAPPKPAQQRHLRRLMNRLGIDADDKPSASCTIMTLYFRSRCLARQHQSPVYASFPYQDFAWPKTSFPLPWDRLAEIDTNQPQTRQHHSPSELVDWTSHHHIPTSGPVVLMDP